MLQAKYKAHRLVNIIFYLIVFLLGFYIGIIGKNIGIKDLFNKFLFIDNVYASNNPSYTHTYSDVSFLDITSDNYKANSNIYAVFQYFKLRDGFIPTIKDVYQYVQVIGKYTAGYESLSTVYYSFSSRSPVCSEWHLCGSKNSILITYTLSSDIWSVSYYENEALDTYIGSNTASNSYSYNYSYGNNPTINLSNYLNILSYNSDLFVSNNNMKEVCVNPHKQFAVSTQQYYNGYNYFSDYIWFPYLIDGIYEGEFSLEDDLITYWNKTGWFLNSKSNIDTYFFPSVGFYPWVYGDTSLLDENFVLNQQTTIYPYANRYSYYGWYALPITFQYNYNNYTSVTTFKFADDYIQTLTYISNGIIPFTFNHYDLTNSENDNLELCFYINKRYDVSYLEKEGSFITGSISTPDGNIDISSIEKDIGFENNDYESLFDYLGEFDNDFGLSTIVLAPLDAIYRISQGVCSPQNITILGKTINLPCGDTIFWDRQDVQPFKIFWNMFWGGIICYNIGIYIFKLVHDYKHPTNDRVEVIDL